MITDKIKKAYEKAVEQHLPKDEVNAVTIGYKNKDGQWTDEVCIGFRVKKKKPPEELTKKEILPKTILGVRTDVIEANYKATGDRTRYPSLVGGISIGREDQNAAGTLGCIVYDEDGVAYALTNAHVACYGSVKSSTEYIVQPGRLDGGIVDSDRIGPLVRGGVNSRGDFAIIKLEDFRRTYNAVINTSDESIVTARLPLLGETVEKVGRTTGLTQGIVNAYGTWLVDYAGTGFSNTAIDGFEIVPLSDPNEMIGDHGDSGSLIYLSGKKTAVGLLTAGSWSPTSIICCYIGNVLGDYDLTFTKESITIKTPETEPSDNQTIYNTINAGWMGVGDQIYTIDMVFKDSFTKVFLYIDDSDYADILWAKLSTEEEYMPIGAFSVNPTCILGDIAKNDPITINLKVISSSEVMGEVTITIKVGYGDLINYGSKIPSQFSWRDLQEGVILWTWGNAS
jgi:hypothetical protein